MSQHKIETGVTLPDSGIVDASWVNEQLERVSAFSAELLAYGRGEVFFLAQSNLSPEGFKQTVLSLDYTVETAQKYIDYLQKRAVLEAIKEKYYMALSLSASEYIPEAIDDAIALCDVCLAKFGRLTADNLKKAAETTGQLPQKMSASAIGVEKLKKQALLDWLLSEHSMTEHDMLDASILHPEGRTEFTEKMSQAFTLLEDWNVFYSIIKDTVRNSEDSKALRFMSDINDASGSILEYLAAEEANRKLVALKEVFESSVYPEFQAKQ